MTAKILCTCALLMAGAAVAADAQNENQKQTNVLLAELITLGKTESSHPTVTAPVRLTNKGTGYVCVLLVGPTSAVDDAGNVFEFDKLAGISYCAGTQNPPSKIICVGKPEIDKRYLLPLETYTEIDPGQ